MPNRCYNSAYITGSKEELKQLKEILQTDKKEDEPYLSFKKILPGSMGINWNIENWGTKWDAGEYDQNCYYYEDRIEFHFTTAWDPPIRLFEYLSVRFPELKIELRFYEPGVNLVGKTIIQAGNLDHKYYDINGNAEEYFTFVEENFDPNIRSQFEYEEDVE